MPTPHLHDGFTITHVIKGRGFVPDLEVTYRPALAARVYQWRKESNRAINDAAADFANDVKLVAERLNSWSLDKPVSAESVGELWPWQLSELVALVVSYVVPDKQGNTPQQTSEKN